MKKSFDYATACMGGVAIVCSLSLAVLGGCDPVFPMQSSPVDVHPQDVSRALMAGRVGEVSGIEALQPDAAPAYRVHVQFDNGDVRTFQQDELAGVRVGDRVRIEGSRIRPS